MSEDITQDDVVCATPDTTNEPESESVNEAVPPKKKKPNPFSWFHSSEMASQQSTDAMQCSKS